MLVRNIYSVIRKNVAGNFELNPKRLTIKLHGSKEMNLVLYRTKFIVGAQYEFDASEISDNSGVRIRMCAHPDC